MDHPDQLITGALRIPEVIDVAGMLKPPGAMEYGPDEPPGVPTLVEHVFRQPVNPGRGLERLRGGVLLRRQKDVLSTVTAAAARQALMVIRSAFSGAPSSLYSP